MYNHPDNGVIMIAKLLNLLKRTMNIDIDDGAVGKSDHDLHDEVMRGDADGHYYYKYHESPQTAAERKRMQEARTRWEEENKKRYEGTSTEDLLRQYGVLFFSSSSGFGDKLYENDHEDAERVRGELLRRGVKPDELTRIRRAFSDPGTLAVGASSENTKHTHGRR